MQKTGTKVIHVAEHDTQIANVPKRPGEFVNTWSIPGFWGEGMQPAELGWGTHEKTLPPEAETHTVGARSASFPQTPGLIHGIRSWPPTGRQVPGSVASTGGHPPP